MRGPSLSLILAVVASPAVAYLVYRAAKELGFLDPPADRQHELRRAILLALYALLVFLPVFLFGWERRWPRSWVIFGFVSGLALLVFAAVALVAARRLWILRHPAAEAEKDSPAAATPPVP